VHTHALSNVRTVLGLTHKQFVDAHKKHRRGELMCVRVNVERVCTSCRPPSAPGPSLGQIGSPSWLKLTFWRRLRARRWRTCRAWSCSWRWRWGGG